MRFRRKRWIVEENDLWRLDERVVTAHCQVDVRDHLLTDQIWSRFDRRIVALRQMDHGSVAGGVTVADIQVDKGDRWVIDGQINFDRSGRTVTKDGTRVDHVCIAARGVLIV